MAIIPRQVRSIDPWSENRFSDNYNLRSRMLTGGNDCVVFLESFEMTKLSDTVLTIGPGIAIKDDVLIHILEDTTMNLALDQGFVWRTGGEPAITNGQEGTHGFNLVLGYQYARSMPAPSARFYIIKDNNMATDFNTEIHMWLARIVATDGVITDISRNPVRLPVQEPAPDPETRTLYSKLILNPMLGYTTINGGVVRPEYIGDSTAGWFEEWYYC